MPKRKLINESQKKEIGSIPVLAVRKGPRDNHAAVPAGGVLPLRGRGVARRRLAESPQRLDRGRDREGQTGI